MRYEREWTKRALCVGRDPGMYELEGFRGDRQESARAACAGCLVVEECAADALDPLSVGTVRGGVWVAPERSQRSAVRRALMDAARGARHA